MDDVLELRCALRALEDFGIVPASEGDEVDASGVAAPNRTRFNATVMRLDPLGFGFYRSGSGSGSSSDDEGAVERRLYGDRELDFVWALLAWSPFHRPTPAQALKHPFFHD